MPWTMIAASIGAQLFNSWQANKKTEELQARQREFQKAAQRREFDRMRQLQREAAQLALEIEADVHKQRLEDIEANYDDVVKQYSTEIAIKKWPLKVLPFVMRGESFGTFFNGSKSIALHTILTPSNCDRFNEAVYMDIDLQLEAACNEHWNAQTSHPIAYYGGAWRKPTLDLDHIDLLKTQLKNVPTVVITPYFGPQLYFKVKMWGMGKDTEVKIELPKNLFSYEYEKGMNYSPKDESPKGDLIDTTIEEFVPYLECLIGYIADQYYWSMYKKVPLLPSLLPNFSNMHNLKNHYGQQYYNVLMNSIKGDNYYKSEYIHYLNILSTSINIFTQEQQKEIYCGIRNNCLNYFEVDIPEYSLITANPILTAIQKLSDTSSIYECRIQEFPEQMFLRTHIDTFDLVLIINEFEKYINTISDRIDRSCISIYIEHTNFKSFVFHLYNCDTKSIITGEIGFDYIYTYKHLKREKNIKDLFHHKKTSSIICKLDRLSKLKRILTNDILLY